MLLKIGFLSFVFFQVSKLKQREILVSQSHLIGESETEDNNYNCKNHSNCSVWFLEKNTEGDRIALAYKCSTFSTGLI